MFLNFYNEAQPDQNAYKREKDSERLEIKKNKVGLQQSGLQEWMCLERSTWAQCDLKWITISLFRSVSQTSLACIDAGTCPKRAGGDGD